MKRNLFIAFEGIDGCGKSTQVKLLAAALRADGHRVYVTFEPTDSPIGSLIRNIFNHRIEADHRTIAGLFVADRLDHLLNRTNGILKKMEEGYTVITDRYYLSSYAYQGTHMPLDWVIEANAMSAELLRPDVNVFIEVPPETCIERLHQTRSNIELYETLDNLRQVRSMYAQAFDRLRDREHIFMTDGNRPPAAVAADIRSEIDRLLAG